jgi:hypothetical protein
MLETALPNWDCFFEAEIMRLAGELLGKIQVVVAPAHRASMGGAEPTL